MIVPILHEILRINIVVCKYSSRYDTRIRPDHVEFADDMTYVIVPRGSEQYRISELAHFNDWADERNIIRLMDSKKQKPGTETDTK